MKRCPKCNHENAQSNIHCERCGTLLVAPLEQTYATVNEAYINPEEPAATTRDYYSTVPPSSPASRNSYQVSMEVPPPPPSTYYTSASYDQGPTPNYRYADPVPVKRSFGAALLSSILYLVGAFCIAFGVSGFLLYGIPSHIVGFAFIAITIVALVLLVPLLIVRKRLVLKWWVRLLIIQGMTIVAILVCFRLAVMNYDGSNYGALGFTFIIYGLATVFVAFW